MTVLQEELTFPALVFWGNMLRFESDWNSLTTTTRAGVKNGMFRDAHVVDANGKSIHLANAEILHGIGFLRGWNIFLNQHVKVRLVSKASASVLSVDAVKSIILKSLRQWHGWASGGNMDVLRKKLSEAASHFDMIEVFRDI